MTVNYQIMPEILVLNKDLEVIDRIPADVYFYWSYTRNYREADTFEFQINKNREKAKSVLRPDTFALAYYDGITTRAGIIEQIECSLDTQGAANEMIKISGRSGGMLSERICLRNTSAGTGYDTISGDAETVMKHYVDVNCINAVDGRNVSAPNRIIPDFELSENEGKGSTVSMSARFDVVSDVLNTVSLSGNIGWEVVFDIESRKFVFQVIEGTSKTATDAYCVIFKPEFNNIDSLDYLWSVFGSKSVCYVAGQDEAAARNVLKVTGTVEPSGFERREVFLDQRQTNDTDTLRTAGVAALEEHAGELSLNTDVRPSASLQYQDDYDLGDIVTVEYGDLLSVDVRIIGVTDAILGGGRGDTRLISLKLGTEAPDIRRIVRKTTKNTKEEMK